MKRKDLVKMVVGIVLVVLLVVAYNKVDMQAIKDWFANLTTTEPTEVVTDGGSQQDTPTVAPIENTATPEPTEEPSSVFVDNMGKTYFYNKDLAYCMVSLQERLDLTAMTKLNVYDIVRANDIVVMCGDGKEITADYGIDLSAVEAVSFFRDGYSLLSYEEDEDKFFKDESSTHTFRGATDSEFTDAVFCDKDIAIKSRVCVAYVNAKLWGVDKEYGCKGWFKMNLLEDRIFKAFVLVKRAVVLEGNTVEMFTWAIRTCDGEPEQPTNGGNGDGGKPSDKPTAEPTIQPTAEPTTKPTHSPTEAPTTAPTEAPTTAPTIEPTVKPTHSPTEAPRPTHSPTEAPRPTHSPTEAPTAAPTKEPTQQPSYKPTPVPEVTPEPTNRHSDTGDEGSGNSHSPTDDDNSTSGGNRHSDASDSSTSNGNRHSEP